MFKAARSHQAIVEKKKTYHHGSKVSSLQRQGKAISIEFSLFNYSESVRAVDKSGVVLEIRENSWALHFLYRVCFFCCISKKKMCERLIWSKNIYH